MPLDKRFPRERRFKVEFSNHPPIYVFHDNQGGWHLDTRFTTDRLRNWIDESFQRLFDEQFPQLYVTDLAGRYRDDILHMFVLHVVFVPDASNPHLILKYYDKAVVYDIPGRITRGNKLYPDEILDELTK